MAYALVAENAGGGDVFTATTPAIDSSGANLLVAGVSLFQGTPAIINPDTEGNTFVGIGSMVTSGDLTARLFYVENPVVGSGHQITCTVNFAPAVALAAFSGAVTSSVLDQSSGAGAAGPSTTQQPGTLTPNADNCLVVEGGHALADSNFVSSISGLTLLTSVPGVLATTTVLRLGYLVQTTATAVNGTVTINASDAIAATQAIFLPGAGGGGGSLQRRHRLALLGVS